MMSSTSSPPLLVFLFLDTGWTDDEDVILPVLREGSGDSYSDTTDIIVHYL